MISPEHLIEYLRANAKVSAAVGTVSIEGVDVVPIVSEISKPLPQLMPRRIIVVTYGGGPDLPGRNHDLARGTMDVRSYGRTVADAWALNDVVYATLRYKGRRSMNGKQVLSVRPVGGAQGRDRVGGWPFVWTSYSLVITEDR